MKPNYGIKLEVLFNQVQLHLFLEIIILCAETTLAASATPAGGCALYSLSIS